MKRRFKIILSSALVLMTIFPLYAVFDEKDLAQTLSVLRYELRQEYNKITTSQAGLDNSHDSQHKSLVGMMKKCNELGLILYSQNQDFTFDMTYALKTVTKEYEDFNKSRLPFDEIINNLDLEIDRYSRLIESLRRLPPHLDVVEGLPDSLAYHNEKVDSTMGFVRRPSADFVREGNNEIVPEEVKQNETEQRKRPFVLDNQGMADRDSCLLYATAILKMYSTARKHIVLDSEHYESANARIEESYQYAQDRYKLIQKRIFIDGQDNYFRVLSRFPRYFSKAKRDVTNKYKGNLVLDEDGAISHSEWRGPMVIGLVGLVLIYILVATVLSLAAVGLLKKKVKWMQTDEFKNHGLCFTLLCGTVIFAITLMIASQYVRNHFFVEASKLLLSFAWLLAAILGSLIIRLKGKQVKTGLKIYTPMISLGFLVIVFRIIFIPNSLVNLILTPVLVAFFIWQLKTCQNNKGKLGYSDTAIGWVSVIVIGLSLAIAVCGYVLLSVQILIWWFFQLSAIETLIAIHALLRDYEDNALKLKVNTYKKERNVRVAKSRKGDNITVTWLFDLLNDSIIPVIGILSIPICLWWASGVFDLTEICKNAFYKDFVNVAGKDGSPILQLSLYKIILVTALFYIFRYAAYLLKALYKHMKINQEFHRSDSTHIRENQFNFTLADNIIGIVVWGSYIVLIILVLRIPMGAISIVAAGLATGIGLALKDILNNFIYGIQLMSGRLRVGDYIECDGVRGVVDSISYQSTQIVTIEGAVISFLNTTLFNKNFKNLTRNNSYEFIKIPVGVAYGSDVDHVREILMNAMETLQGKDKFGRDIIDRKRGVTVAFDEFGESSVDLAVKQFVLVEERAAFIANAKEAIYDALNANGIEIPFPQRDVNIKSSNG